MKYFFTGLIIFGAFLVSAQEFNLGGSFGTNIHHNYSDFDNFELYQLSTSIEYRPKKMVWSLNLDPALLYYYNDYVLSFPLYFKIIIGNKYRVCPIFGGAIRSDHNYSLNLGLLLEFKTSEYTFLFAKGSNEYFYYDNFIPLRSGVYGKMKSVDKYFLLQLGVKINILRK